MSEKQQLINSIRNMTAAVEEAHDFMDAAGVPKATGHTCDDPHCNSHLAHRVRLLIGERDAKSKEITALRQQVEIAVRLAAVQKAELEVLRAERDQTLTRNRLLEDVLRQVGNHVAMMQFRGMNYEGLRLKIVDQIRRASLQPAFHQEPPTLEYEVDGDAVRDEGKDYPFGKNGK